MSVDVGKYVDAENGLVWGEIFHSQEIYEAELKNIFARSWSFLAHDSMISKPGDFLQTYIGEDPVVVVRQRDGSVRAFLNQCRHRGMRICRVDRGNARAFMCSFHGWTYDTAGNLTSVPHEEEAYPQGLRKEELGPAQLRVASYKGFIFGNWDPTAPSFETYLGDMAWYFDAYVDRYEGGLEAVAVHKWVLQGNWKLNAEQPSSDLYHGEVTHASALQVMGNEMIPLDEDGQPEGPRPAAGLPFGNQFSAPHGHGCGWFNFKTSFSPLHSAWEASIRDGVVARIGERRTDYVPDHANIFPNFMFLGNGTMRVTHPRGPHEMEIWAWTFVPTEAPREVKEEMRLTVLRTFSPGGMFEQDDAENWAEEQRILRGYMARQKPLVYTMHLDTPRTDLLDLPGRTAPHAYADLGARGLYEHWLDMMSGAPWSEITQIKARRAEAIREQERRLTATDS